MLWFTECRYPRFSPSRYKQSNREESRLTTAEKQIFELPTTVSVQANNLSIEHG